MSIVQQTRFVIIVIIIIITTTTRFTVLRALRQHTRVKKLSRDLVNVNESRYHCCTLHIKGTLSSHTGVRGEEGPNKIPDHHPDRYTGVV